LSTYDVYAPTNSCKINKIDKAFKIKVGKYIFSKYIGQEIFFESNSVFSQNILET
jgi:hypothetical protein